VMTPSITTASEQFLNRASAPATATPIPPLQRCLGSPGCAASPPRTIAAKTANGPRLVRSRQPPAARAGIRSKRDRRSRRHTPMTRSEEVKPAACALDPARQGDQPDAVEARR
jgi:hypothetical protein